MSPNCVLTMWSNSVNLVWFSCILSGPSTWCGLTAS